ncbi:MAG: metallophosphoesterase [Deltaproteobacteria bacterium]|nr:metallophosphoesterase [Deltaproteobacteria bacterium]
MIARSSQGAAIDRASAASVTAPPIRFPRRPLPPPRAMSGRKRRWIYPNRGLIKRLERGADVFASRHLYPHLLGIWSPYSWQLPRRLVVSEATLAPRRWPARMPPLRVLLLTDLHVGPFLLPSVLHPMLAELMRLEPDLVAIGGDVISGRAHDLGGFLEGLAELARAPLGAWFCMGNHEYFSPDPFYVVEQLRAVGIHTLRNHAVRLEHGGSRFVLGGLDDLVLGVPDWERLLSAAGAPHVLLAHNPDAFYEAERRGIGLVLSGHTHAGQIRFPGGPPLVRQSRFCLDEGVMSFGSSLIVVSRGLGASGLPWRVGARPEAVLLTIRPG